MDADQQSWIHQEKKAKIQLSFNLRYTIPDFDIHTRFETSVRWEEIKLSLCKQVKKSSKECPDVAIWGQQERAVYTMLCGTIRDDIVNVLANHLLIYNQQTQRSIVIHLLFLCMSMSGHLLNASPIFTLPSALLWSPATPGSRSCCHTMLWKQCWWRQWDWTKQWKCGP